MLKNRSFIIKVKFVFPKADIKFICHILATLKSLKVYLNFPNYEKFIPKKIKNILP